MGNGAENHKATNELIISAELDSERVTGVRVIQPTNEVHLYVVIYYNGFRLWLKCIAWQLGKAARKTNPIRI